MTEIKKEKSKFLKTFFSERKQVGAVAPSSRFLVKKMCDKIDFDSARNIIELGPGTGVFTEELIKRAHPDCRIFVIELNEEFYDFLKKRFKDKRVILLRESADQLDEIIKRHGVEKVDAILSSLPLAVIPEQIKKRIIIKAYDVLRKGGVFVQYQYSLNAKKLLEMKFGKLKMGFVTINIPPAFVYLGIK
ncbi:MAG: class I SAM-dependent methyltransferase [Crocinitomicaceae bacterium]